MYRYPRKRIKWQTFYAKSAKGVAHLFHSRTNEFHKFWELSKESNDFRKTFFQAFDMTPEQFSNEFEEKMSKKSKTKALLLSLGFTWSLLPFLALIVWGLKKLRNRIILKNWEDEELRR